MLIPIGNRLVLYYKLDSTLVFIAFFTHYTTINCFRFTSSNKAKFGLKSTLDLQNFNQIKSSSTHKAFKHDSTIYNFINNKVNDKFNCLSHVCSNESILEQINQAIQFSKNSELHLFGLTYTLKDNFAVKGSVNSNGSKLLANYKPSFTSSVVRMLSSAGSIMVGRTAMDEFAMGSRTPSVTNPAYPNCYAGGSSGGTAASVASGIVSFGLCSDTGGSSRIPASFCNITGFKPTTNLISRHGLSELSSNMDSVGIITKNVDQLLPILQALTKYDPNDMAQNKHLRNKSFPRDLENESTNHYDTLNYIPPKGLTINIANDLTNATSLQYQMFKDYHDRVIEPTRQLLQSKNIIFKNIQLPNNNDIIKTYYIYVSAQTRTNLARFRSKKYDLDNMTDISNTNLLGDEPRFRYNLGELILKSSDPDKLFNNLKEKLELWSKYILSPNSYLILPTHVEDVPLKYQSNESDSEIDESYVILSSILGLPSITIPISIGNDNTGKPSSIQLVGPKYSDFELVKLASYLKGLIVNS